MSISTTRARMQQLVGKYSELNTDNILIGELAVPNDHNPLIKRADGKVQEIPLLSDMDSYEAKIEEVNNALDRLTEEYKNKIDEIISLTRDYSKSAQVSAQKAQENANSANSSATSASASATKASTSEANAKTSETNASAYASNAKASEDSTTASKTASATSEANAKKYADQAKTSATNASSSASNAKTSETNAKTSEGNSALSEQEAQKYAEQVKEISESFSGALRPLGTITFANLPDTSDAASGDMYNISDQFTTTTSFKEGSGNIIPAGSNVYLTIDRMWDVLAGTPVTGIKGNAETSYRRGNVNITKANIGLDKVDNTADLTKVVADMDMPAGTQLMSDIKVSSFNELTPAYYDVTSTTGNSRPSHGSVKTYVASLTKNILNPIVTVINNLVAKLGINDISKIGDGTVTGAVSTLNANLANIENTQLNNIYSDASHMRPTIFLDINAGQVEIKEAIQNAMAQGKFNSNGSYMGLIIHGSWHVYTAIVVNTAQYASFLIHGYDGRVYQIVYTSGEYNSMREL